MRKRRRNGTLGVGVGVVGIFPLFAFIVAHILSLHFTMGSRRAAAWEGFGADDEEGKEEGEREGEGEADMFTDPMKHPGENGGRGTGRKK